MLTDFNYFVAKLAVLLISDITCIPLCSSLASYSTGNIIKLNITSSKLPLNSLLRSLIKSYRKEYVNINTN